MHKTGEMKIMIFSNDSKLLKMIQIANINDDTTVSVLNESQDPLDIMSAICAQNPSLVVLDDDFVKPHSAHVIRSVRKINSKVNFIFVTSDESVELGREISPLGIHYYGHKPLAQSELHDSIESIIKLKSNISTT
jgi:DNA-binding NarL/FixJ family response regulator